VNKVRLHEKEENLSPLPKPKLSTKIKLQRPPESMKKARTEQPKIDFA